MQVLTLQYSKHSGPDAIGQHHLSFTMDESVAKDFNVYTKKGTQFLVILIPVDSSEMNEFASETKDDTLKRFKKMMEALIGELADMQETDKVTYRNQVKDYLRIQGRIKESTGELDLEGLAYTINHLRKVKYDLEHNQN